MARSRTIRAFVQQVLPCWSGASSSSQASTSASAWFPPRLAQHTRQGSGPAQQSCFSTQPSTPQPASRLNTWKGPKGQPPPQRPVDAAAAEPAGPVTAFFSHKEALQAIPLFPKALGFAGALPFMFLSAPMLEALELQGLTDKAAQAQVVYAAMIISFLGAVHWGLAMASPATSKALTARYVWSVTPSLIAWPLPLMQTGPASIAAAGILGVCYLQDKSFYRAGALPKWYMALRGYLTTAATISMLLTGFHYLREDVKREKERLEQEQETVERKRAEATLPPPPASVAATAVAKR